MNIDLAELARRVENFREAQDGELDEYDDDTLGAVLAVLYELIDRGE